MAVRSAARRLSSTPPPLPVTLADVREAARLLSGVVLRTPLLSSAALDARAGVRARLKCEHLQPTGSFKFRGAAHAVLRLPPDAAARGVVAHSAGNHGAALAAAAAARGLRCVVAIPHDAPAAKEENVARYGARVRRCDPSARAAVAAEEAAAMGGAAVVPPYDDAAVIAGQGTMALELLEEAPRLDAILVPVSGGGMLGGVAAAARALAPRVRVIAVEPAGKRLGEALAKGERVVDAARAGVPLRTCADAIRTQALGELPWALAQQLVDRAVLSVDDEEIAAAMRFAMTELKQVLEPAGAVTIAALCSPGFAALRDEAAAAGRPLKEVAAILCGGNIDPESLHAIVSRARS